MFSRPFRPSLGPLSAPGSPRMKLPWTNWNCREQVEIAVSMLKLPWVKLKLPWVKLKLPWHFWASVLLALAKSIYYPHHRSFHWSIHLKYSIFSELSLQNKAWHCGTSRFLSPVSTMTPFWHAHTKKRLHFRILGLPDSTPELFRARSQKRKHWGRNCYGELTSNDEQRKERIRSCYCKHALIFRLSWALLRCHFVK